jgi:hypothetical protein
MKPNLNAAQKTGKIFNFTVEDVVEYNEITRYHPRTVEPQKAN